MSSQAAPSYHILQYQYVPDILEKRGPYREGHLGAARKLEKEGKCVLGGAFGDPVEGAIFILKNMNTQDIEKYVQEDPYVKNALVTSWKILPYMVAVGGK